MKYLMIVIINCEQKFTYFIFDIQSLNKGGSFGLSHTVIPQENFPITAIPQEFFDFTVIPRFQNENYRSHCSLNFS